MAADHAVRISGLPALQLWERLLDRPLSLEVYQDNQATARIMSTGLAPILRPITRTQVVSVAWIHERVSSPNLNLHDSPSDVMAADNLTKHVINLDRWISVCELIGVVRGSSSNRLSPLCLKTNILPGLERLDALSR